MKNQATISDFMPEAGDGETTEGTPSEKKRYQDAEWLREQYWEKGFSQRKIGEIEDVTRQTISKWMKKLDVKTRAGSETRSKGDLSRLESPDWLREKYHEEGLTQKEIANLLEVSETTVMRSMDEHGIERRPQSEIQSEGDTVPLRDPDWLREMYQEKRLNSTEIAEHLGVSKSTVLDWLERHDIERRLQAQSLSEGDVELLRNHEYLNQKYHEEELSSREIAEEIGVCKSTVLNWLGRHEIETRSQIEAKADGNISKINDADWLRDEYIDKERSMEEIAEEFGVTIQAVKSACERYDIPIRSISEAKTDVDISRLQDEDWLQEQYNEKGLTMREIGEKVGVTVTPVQTWMNEHGIDTMSKIYRPDHLNHIVRSGWERLVAELLVDAGVDYEYESLEICYGDDRIYKPDFVTDSYVIEVKGRLHPNRNPEKKAKASIRQLSHREYVVVGGEPAKELPADIYIQWENRKSLLDLFE